MLCLVLNSPLELIQNLWFGFRPARIVNVSSLAHKFGTMQFDDIMSEKSYGRWRAYGQSKLSNILFTSELSKRLPSDWAITTNSLHPGSVSTELQRCMNRRDPQDYCVCEYLDERLGFNISCCAETKCDILFVLP